MNLHKLVRTSQKAVLDNSATILTAVGVSGVALTAFLTGKASFKAAEILERDHRTGGVSDDRTKQLKYDVGLVWKLYIPPAAAGVMTAACVVGSNRISNRRGAALAAAYSLSERAYSEYKEKVVEKFGEKKEEKIRAEIAQDRVAHATSGAMVVGAGEVLCFDQPSGRLFTSTMDKLQKAQNEINHRLNNDGYASLGDFYSLVELPGTSMSEELGWNADKLLELRFSSVIVEDKPTLAYDFSVTPIRNYYRQG